MRIFLIPVLLFGLFAASPTRAQQAAPSPEALAVAREMMALVTSDLVDQVNSTLMDQALRPLTTHPSMTPKKMRELQTEVERITERFIDRSLTEMPAVYARHLSIVEMREITAFYRTPTGAKTLKLFPQITREIVELFRDRMPDMQMELAVVMQRILQ